MDRREAAWQAKLSALRAYVAAHGALPPRGDAAGLGAWVNDQRHGKKAMDAGKAGKVVRGMTPERAAALATVPGWAWVVDAETAWRAKLEALRAYAAAHGALPPPTHPSGLGKWVHNQRQGKKAMDAGKAAAARQGMTPARVSALEAVPGWTWAPQAAPWGERLAELKAHVREYGSLPPSDVSGLGRWMQNQRQAKKAADAGRRVNNKMTPERVAALEAVPCWTWDASRKRARDDNSSSL